MKQAPVFLRKKYAGAPAGTGMTLLCGVLVFLFSFLLRPTLASGGSEVSGLLQEKIGYTVQALGRYDQQRQSRLQEQWALAVRQLGNLSYGRDARLQEELGHAISRTDHAILKEQASLKKAVIEAVEELQRFHRERSARRQEQLGLAVLWAARRFEPGGDAFRAAFQKKANHLKIIDERIGRRLEDRLQGLLARQAEFPKIIPLLYQEAIQSAHRSHRMLEESQIAWTNRVLQEVRKQLNWQRQSQDYVQLARVVQENLLAHYKETKGEGYGFLAFLGLMLGTVWIASISRKDLVGSIAFAPAEAASFAKSSIPHLWGKEVFTRSQLTPLFSWPKEVLFGNNVSHEIGRYAAKNMKRRAMMITDKGIRQNGLLDPLEFSFSQAGVEYRVFDQVQREVPDTVIAELLDQCRRERIDLLVAVGGGSVIDTTKAVGILLTNGGKIQDYEGVDKVRLPIPSFYVVPTTSGCGSEASQFCVVLDTLQKKKIEIFSRCIIPQMIFIDPMLTLTMPAELTASSGIDALANAIEAYFSTWASPLTDALSLHAIRLISGSLRSAVVDRMNLEAREQMAMAAFEAGLAFTNAHAGAVHALGHSIAGLLNVPQRLGDAILLPHVMRHNMNTNLDRMVDVAFAMGEKVEALSKPEAAEKAIVAVQCLMVDIGLPTTLDKVGVMKEKISELSQLALQDAFLKTNPCILTQRDIESIYERAFQEYSEAVHTCSGHQRVMFN
jgi:1,3-propanediol dehydrogenase